MKNEQMAVQANTDLITAISHDIRTPLTALLGYLDLAVEGQYDSEQTLKQYLHVSQEKALQLKSMTDELFQYFLVFFFFRKCIIKLFIFQKGVSFMICITDFLAHIRLTMKLQEQMLKNICETWQLTITEGKVISFLYNNPGKDTAADITELRMLSKGNVSQAVESLIQKGLLKRTADQTDRRKIHLSLLPQTADITAAICSMQANLYSQIFCGLSEEDLKFYEQINQQIMENTKKAIKERTTENEFTAKER